MAKKKKSTEAEKTAHKIGVRDGRIEKKNWSTAAAHRKQGDRRKKQTQMSPANRQKQTAPANKKQKQKQTPPANKKQKQKQTPPANKQQTPPVKKRQKQTQTPPAKKSTPEKQTPPMKSTPEKLKECLESEESVKCQITPSKKKKHGSESPVQGQASGMTGDLKKLQERLGYKFKDEGLLVQALTHSSYANEKDLPNNYQRLEFLGDAVIELIISQKLFKLFPEASEGALSKYRAQLVCDSSLASRAQHLDMGRCILLGKTGGDRFRPALLADIFEAVVGAIFVDRGKISKRLKSLVLEQFEEQIQSINLTCKGSPPQQNAKSELQELLMSISPTLPCYTTEKEGPDHLPLFSCCVTYEGDVLGTGVGKNKKEAETAAATAALANWHKTSKKKKLESK